MVASWVALSIKTCCSVHYRGSVLKEGTSFLCNEDVRVLILNKEITNIGEYLNPPVSELDRLKGQGSSCLAAGSLSVNRLELHADPKLRFASQR